MAIRVIRGVVELGKYLGVSYLTARRIIERPDFPLKVVSQRVRLIDEAALKEWLSKPKREGR
ncbi:MAG: hypothetical protein LBS11_11265 [Oscillospiraceae bacterium]|jgi:hypothetical protein|nr:hypothetical protein [Oscillospiraceae bacterium]